MGEGLPPNLDMSLMDGFTGYAENEAKTAARLVRV
jgi:hypothetical protein